VQRDEDLLVTGLPLASLQFLVQCVIVVPDVGEPGFVALPQTAQQVKERYVDPVRALGSA